MKNFVTLFLVFLFIDITLSSFVLADKHQTSIDSNVSIDVKIGKVRNIIENSSKSKSKMSVGSIRQSDIHDRVQMQNIRVGNIVNNISNAKDSRVTTNIAHIENSTVNNATIEVNGKSLKNSVTGGKHNHAIVKIGTITNSLLTGKTNTTIKFNQVDNLIKGGNNNIAEVSIGTIDNDRFIGGARPSQLGYNSDDDSSDEELGSNTADQEIGRVTINGQKVLIVNSATKGGTAKEQQMSRELEQAFKAIVKTDYGKKLLARIQKQLKMNAKNGKTAGALNVSFNSTNNIGTFGYGDLIKKREIVKGTPHIYDPSIAWTTGDEFIKGKVYRTSNNKLKVATVIGMLSHEMNHNLVGTGDVGDLRMDNEKESSWRVMAQLGFRKDQLRICYYPTCTNKKLKLPFAKRYSKNPHNAAGFKRAKQALDAFWEKEGRTLYLKSQKLPQETKKLVQDQIKTANERSRQFNDKLHKMINK